MKCLSIFVPVADGLLTSSRIKGAYLSFQLSYNVYLAAKSALSSPPKIMPFKQHLIVSNKPDQKGNKGRRILGLEADIILGSAPGLGRKERVCQEASISHN